MKWELVALVFWLFTTLALSLGFLETHFTMFVCFLHLIRWPCICNWIDFWNHMTATPCHYDLISVLTLHRIFRIYNSHNLMLLYAYIYFIFNMIMYDLYSTSLLVILLSLFHWFFLLLLIVLHVFYIIRHWWPLIVSFLCIWYRVLDVLVKMFYWIPLDTVKWWTSLFPFVDVSSYIKLYWSPFVLSFKLMHIMTIIHSSKHWQIWYVPRVD